MANSGENRNQNSNKGKPEIYGRRKQKTVGLRLDEETLDKFTEVSKEKGISKQLILEGLLKEYLKREGK